MTLDIILKRFADEIVLIDMGKNELFIRYALQ